GEQFVIEGAGFDNRRDTLEPVPLADKRIDDVHFHVDVPSQVRESAGRSDVGEDEMIVIPDRRRSLGRQLRRSRRTHGGDEAEALLLDDSLHVVGQNPHGCVTFMPPTAEGGIDAIDPSYYTVADGNGQTTAAREAGLDVGRDPRSA